MNLRRRTEFDTLDLALKHTLKNWTTHQRPPADGKDRLLNAVTKGARKSGQSRVALFFLWAFNDQYNNIYLERFRDIHHIYLASGAISAH